MRVGQIYLSSNKRNVSIRVLKVLSIHNATCQILTSDYSDVEGWTVGLVKDIQFQYAFDYWKLISSPSKDTRPQWF